MARNNEIGIKEELGAREGGLSSKFREEKQNMSQIISEKIEKAEPTQSQAGFKIFWKKSEFGKGALGEKWEWELKEEGYVHSQSHPQNSSFQEGLLKEQGQTKRSPTRHEEQKQNIFSFGKSKELPV